MHMTVRLACIAALLVVGTAAAQAQVGPGAQPLTYGPEGYPDWRSAWVRIPEVGNRWNPASASIDDVPLTEEGRRAFDDGQADQAAGGQGNDPTWRCLPPGMPRAMTAILPMEIVITPEVTYLSIEYANQLRRIYTDRRDFPDFILPTFIGYSIGEWEDADGDGAVETLVIETRGMKGPRTYDSTGIPLHPNDETVVFERIYLDPEDPDYLVNEITTHDDYLTEPWTVIKRYTRDREPLWTEYACAEGNSLIEIGDQIYFLDSEGILMPTRADQTPPDLRHFTAAAD